MNRIVPVLAAIAFTQVAGPPPTFASLKELADGVFIEDFEDGKLDQWGVDTRDKKQETRLPQTLEIVNDEGKAALHLKGGAFHNRIFCLDRKFKDFSLEVRMKKTSGNYAGIVVRDHWRVYLQMRGYVSLNSDAPGLESKGELFKSGQAFTGYHTLKIVCAGPLLHVYVDGQPILDYEIGPGEGRIGFYAHSGGEAYYDDLRIDTHLDPAEYVAVEPRATDDCLVFSPMENVKLRFAVSNYADSQQRVIVAASVKRWSGETVKNELTQDLSVGPGANGAAEFDMGRIPAGFYSIDLQASCAGKQVCSRSDLPLAVQEQGAGDYKPPIIPVAAYYKYYCPTQPIYHNTYAHAAARSLRDHNFNAVVADPSFTRKTVDIFQSYGIATIARGESLLDHPAVIATLVADEPKPEEIDQLRQQYQQLREKTDKPITTCMVGDTLGLGREGDAVWIWRQLQPDLRCFRWYGIKKSFYGILHDVKYKPYLPLSSVLCIAEACSDTPYWFIAPGLGKPDHEAYYHRPTPAEIKGMMHLALAYGADGILFFAFQSHRTFPCLVEQQSLQPVDANYAAAAEVAAKIQAHADLIKSLEHGGLDVRCPSPLVDAVPRKSTKDNTVYVYAVNKDTQNPVATCLLLWAETWEMSRVTDVFSGEELAVQRDEEGYLRVLLSLDPGEGRLLATDAALASASPKP